MLICDDLGVDDLQCFGAPIPSPNILQLAFDGARLNHYNSAHSTCAASHTALLTGRYAPRSIANPELPSKSSDAEEETLARLFHDKGYRSLSVGRWGFGEASEELTAFRGFDSYFNFVHGEAKDPNARSLSGEQYPAQQDSTLLMREYTAAATHFIEQSADRPFFLHLVYPSPEDQVRTYSAGKKKSSFGPYGDFVAEMDLSVGMLLQTLAHVGATENTIVWFSSSNGPGSQGSNGELRGRKGSTLEGGCRVPLIVRWPGRIKEGSVQGGWATSLDAMPTLAAWCGLTPSRVPLDGIDMVHIFRGERSSRDYEPQLYFSQAGGSWNLQCIRAADWKLHVAQAGEDSSASKSKSVQSFFLPSSELYSVSLDPGESYNLAAANPRVVFRLLQEIDVLIATFPPEIQDNYRRLKGRPAAVTKLYER